MKSDARLCRYLPTCEMNVGRYPNREYFWGVAFTIIPIWANQSTKLVMSKRYAQVSPDLNAAKIINVSENWIRKLSQHDFTSSSKYTML